MGFTDKYELEDMDYSVADKSGIVSADMEKVDDHLHTRLLATLGEAVSQYETLYVASNSKWSRAKADQTKMPSLGLAIESGILDDEIRVQRVGPITNPAWSWTVPNPVFLSPTVLGGLTQTLPSSDRRQLMGIPETATKLILTGTVEYSTCPQSTTTTTTTTSTTSTTSTTTTT